VRKSRSKWLLNRVWENSSRSLSPKEKSASDKIRLHNLKLSYYMYGNIIDVNEIK
jgi:hypothetical protein